LGNQGLGSGISAKRKEGKTPFVNVEKKEFCSFQSTRKNGKKKGKAIGRLGGEKGQTRRRWQFWGGGKGL